MINIEELNRYIMTYVFENEEGLITGEAMQGVLLKMVEDLGVPVNELSKALDALAEKVKLDGDRLAGDIKQNTNRIIALNNAISELKAELTKKAGKTELAKTNANVLANTEAIVQNSGRIADLEEKSGRQEADLTEVKQAVTDANVLIGQNVENILKNSNAIQVINGKMGVAGGIAILDKNGKIPEVNMPDGVYAYIQGKLDSTTQFTDRNGVVWDLGSAGIADKLFIDLDTNKFYRWDGAKFISIIADLRLGETEGTAYEGIKGKRNADNIKSLQKKVADHETRITSNEEDIKDLYATTQIADLDVEIRNVGGGLFVSSERASDIYNYAIKGGNVKIQYGDKKYEFVTYRNRTAYFRYLVVLPDRVSEEDIEIYEKDAVFKTIEYEAVFDATPLLTSFIEQKPLSDDFIANLDKAIAEKKLIYVTGNGSIYLLTGTSKTATLRSFTGIGRNTIYVLSYSTSKIVSLDTHTIGADIHIFNNENSVNILNLTTESTNSEIKEVFTDSNGDVIIPHANDIFYIYQNADVSNNGSVESMVEDSYEIRLAVNMSNFENNLIHRVFYNISYDANVGVNSLRITNKVDNIINPSKLTEPEMDKLNTKAEKGVTALDKAEKVSWEINEYNISKINQSVYDLQGAISALNEYLGGGSRSFGMKVTFIDSSEMIPKTFEFMKGTFTSILSWKEAVPYRIINQLVCGLDSFGHARGLSVDIEDMYKICGFDLILYGHGSPSALTIPKQNGVPAFIGQVYIDLDASNNGRYYSKGTHSVLDWVK